MTDTRTTRGKTIVLVTHDMASVEDYCHRAMLIGDGKIQRIGDPAEIGREYLRLNFESRTATGVESSTTGGDVSLLDAWVDL